MFETEVFRKQMYCIEESTCDIVGNFRRPGIVLPLSSLVTPLSRTYSFEDVYLINSAYFAS